MGSVKPIFLSTLGIGNVTYLIQRETQQTAKVAAGRSLGPEGFGGPLLREQATKERELHIGEYTPGKTVWL